MHSSQIPTLSLFKRQTYIDVENPAEAQSLGYEYFQLKYDGIWARVVISKGTGIIYSRNEQVKSTFTTEIPDCVLIGEFMFGTNWANRTGRAGQIFVFDVESIGYVNYAECKYDFRYSELVKFSFYFPQLIKVVGIGRIGDADIVWDKIKSGEADYEGLVFRKFSDLPTAILARAKREITDDVVVMDKYEGNNRLEGTLGGLVVGKYKDGILTPLYKVGGGFDDPLRHEIWNNWNDWYLSVIECKGKARFDTGALRHPNFSRRRPDKQPSECIFTRNES